MNNFCLFHSPIRARPVPCPYVYLRHVAGVESLGCRASIKLLIHRPEGVLLRDLGRLLAVRCLPHRLNTIASKSGFTGRLSVTALSESQLHASISVGIGNTREVLSVLCRPNVPNGRRDQGLESKRVFSHRVAQTLNCVIG